MAIKTKAVVLKDGREGRGVKVSVKNFKDAAEWAGDHRTMAVVKVAPKKSGKPDSDHRVRLYTKKGVRVARVGDVIVKLAKDDYIVIKADEFETFVKI